MQRLAEVKYICRCDHVPIHQFLAIAQVCKILSAAAATREESESSPISLPNGTSTPQLGCSNTRSGRLIGPLFLGLDKDEGQPTKSPTQP